MRKVNYRIVSCEGGDQCGKGDAILTFREKFLKSGVSVTFSSFPIYASPFGVAIRKFLNEGMEDFGFSPRKELKIKMALYALNRLEFLDVVLSNSKYRKTLILLDRSSFSNAVTLAYGLVNIEDLTNEEIEKYVKYAFWLDGVMIRKLKLKNCVVQMVALNTLWNNLRNGGQKDINENANIQSMTEKTYDLFQDKVGKGWKKVVTKMEGEWGTREDIFQSIYDFVVSRYGEFNLEVFPENYGVNIEEIIENSYLGAKVKKGHLQKYLKAVYENDKEPMYSHSIKVGEEIASSCKDFILINTEVKRKFYMIFKDLPQIYIVLGKYLGQDFVKTLRKSIEKWEKKK